MQAARSKLFDLLQHAAALCLSALTFHQLEALVWSYAIAEMPCEPMMNQHRNPTQQTAGSCCDDAGGQPVTTAAGSVPATDPVCGMKVDPNAGKPSQTWKGKAYHFCSAGCRERSLSYQLKSLPWLSQGAIVALRAAGVGTTAVR